MVAGQVTPRLSRRPQDVAVWLQSNPSLTQLRAAYPAEWERVERELAPVLARGDAAQLQAWLVAAATPSAVTPGHARAKDVVLSEAIRRHMIVAAVKQAHLSASTGVTHGKLRFGLVNGYILQKLLFERGMRRKPVRLMWFRLLWPLLRQRRYLMPLVMREGIYCFYSRRLITSLAKIIEGRACLEIAAGDGTLSRFLGEQGVQVTATDDYSWQDSVQYDAEAVTRRNAAKALREHKPQVVICSWPPPGNSFERHVFATPSVQLYILISSRQEVAAGNWDSYRRQDSFDFAEDTTLSRLIVPSDSDGAVYLFQRRRPV